jgi:hypothetical protein
MPGYTPIDSSMEDDDDLTANQRMARIISPDSDSTDITGPAKGTPAYQPPAQNTAGIPATVSATSSTPAWHPPMSGGPNPNSGDTPAWHPPMSVPGSFSSVMDPTQQQAAAAQPAAATNGVDPNSFAAKQLAAVGPAPQVDTARLAALQAQRARYATPTPINDPNHPEYRPGIGTKIRRGIGAYFAGGPGAVLETNYSAPTRKYALAEQARQANLGQAGAQISDFDTLQKEQQANYTGKLNEAKDAITLQRNDEASQARNDANDVRQQLATTREQLANEQGRHNQATEQTREEANDIRNRSVDAMFARIGATIGDKANKNDLDAQGMVEDHLDKKQSFADQYERQDDGSYSNRQTGKSLTGQEFNDKIEGFRGDLNKRMAAKGYQMDAKGNIVKGSAIGPGSARPANGAARPAAAAPKPGVNPQTSKPWAPNDKVVVDGKPAVVTGVHPNGKPIVRYVK